MNFNELKRKSFFWLDRLQISRMERIGIAALMGLLVVLLGLNVFLQKSYNYDKEQYEAIRSEFERRSALIEQEQKEIAEKYNPGLTVNEPASPEETVPEMEEAITEVQEQNPAPASTELININEANLEQLQTLKGIGATYARRIIDYREAHGDFKSIDELKKVKGIGEKRLENIKPFIKL